VLDGHMRVAATLSTTEADRSQFAMRQPTVARSLYQRTRGPDLPPAKHIDSCPAHKSGEVRPEAALNRHAPR